MSGYADKSLEVSGSQQQRVFERCFFFQVWLSVTKVPACLDAQTVQLQIQDTGPGIDPQILPQIFDRFYSGDQSRTNKGNGLGLSYVRAIVQAHHGQIHVSSSQAPSKDNISPTGAIFTITLPSANSL